VDHITHVDPIGKGNVKYVISSSPTYFASVFFLWKEERKKDRRKESYNYTVTAHYCCNRIGG
jgi:hypothetical protein